MTFNTGNPIGSTDARDLSDNAENFDKALGTLDATWTDRLGVTRDSFEGRLAKGSFYRVGTFAEGYTLTNMRQTLEYSGHEYSWAGMFPKVVAPGATPATSGGIGAGAWVDRTDVTLRSELLAVNGASLSLSQVATNYKIKFEQLGIWNSGETLSVGDYRWFDNNVWAPNSNTSICGESPDYTNFHTVRPDKKLTPVEFGADLTTASQDAVNRLFVYVTSFSVGLAYIDQTYLISPSTHAGLAGTFGENSVCLNLLSNLKVWGEGGFKLIDGATGSSGAMLGNWAGGSITDCIVDVDIDGNKANTTGTISGVVFVGGVRCQFINGRKIVNTSYNGLQFAVNSLACVADRPYIYGVGYIGLQMQRPDGGQILFPRIYSVGDNAIDIEANNSGSDQTQIVGPTINGCNCGIFLESTGNVIVTGGSIEVCSSYCINLNQISTPSTMNIISGVKMNRGVGYGTVAVYINNNSGYTSIYGCRFEGFSHSFSLNTAVGVHIGVNNHNGITKSIVNISRSENALIRSYVAEQIVETPKVSGKPFTCSPIDNALNFSGRDFSSDIKPARFLYTNSVASDVDSEYIAKTYPLTQNPAWSNAYAVYSGGETLVYIISDTPTVGGYIRINGVVYLIYSSPSGGVFSIRSSFGVAGDYAAALNSNYTVTEYYPEYMTA